MVKIIRPQRLELASIKGGRDITRPYFGKMLEPLDSVLAGQGRDYQVYEELLKDSQVHSCFQQLSDRISECETTILPGGERPIDLAAAEAFELVLKAIGWDEITKRMAYARIFGFSVAEVLWGVGGAIECIKVRAQRRFKFDEDLNLRLLTMTNSYEGELLPGRKFWHLSMGGWRSDEPYGLGLGHQLYWPVYFKKNGVLSWLRFLEKYGHPLPLVRHAEGATDDQKREAIYLAQSLAEDSAAAGSENLTFDLIESSRNGTADYTQLVETMDAQIAKIILSQGMTTDNGSSRAQADVHNGVADSIVKSLSDLICESFNKSIVTWWTEFNFPGAMPPQVWRRTEPESDLVAIVARDKTLWEMGFPPTAEYIVETYGEGFRPPERGEDAPIALNGAQVTALTTTISQAISDGWIPELAVATIRASFPTIGADLITAIAEQLQAQVDKSAELAKPQEAIVSPDVAAAQFGEVEGTIDFAPAKGLSKGGKAGAKNCKKGHICGKTCIAKNRTCKSDATPQQVAMKQAKVKKTKGGGGGGTPDVAKVVPPVASVAAPVVATDVKLNQSELDAKRAELEKTYGKKTLDDAEANTKKILNDSDTNVFIRVGSSETLGLILGDRFKTSAELGVTTHKVPDLRDKNYQDARNRVEAKSLGYGLNTKPEDRPIYGYLGGKDLNGNAHLDVSQSYGSIAVKLRSDVKDRTSFTGADTFKSGIASKLSDPNAASIASVTKFGHDTNHPDVKSLDSTKAGIAAQKRQLELAAKAKNIDELNGLAPTGNKYIEAQVHGKVGPKDIAEIHFQPKDRNDRPTPEIAQMAKANGIDLYVNGKKVNPDDIINAKDPRSQRLKDLDAELNTAMKTGDFGKVADITAKIAADAKTTKLAPGEKDAVLKTLSKEAGFSEAPTVLNKKSMDAAASDGATLMTRGIRDAGTVKAKDMADQFRSGEFFTGNGIYGNGTYVGHSGTFVQGKPGNSIVSKGRSSSFNSDRFIPGNNAADSKAAWNGPAGHNYINNSTVNMRMALPKDANVVTHSTIQKEVSAVREGIGKWSDAEKKKLQQDVPPATLKAIAKGEKDFKASIDTKSAGFIPDPGASYRGEIRFAKKDGSGVESFPIEKTGMGYVIKAKDGNNQYLTLAAAKKHAIETMSKDAGKKAAGIGISTSDVSFRLGALSGTTIAKIPGLKDDFFIKTDSDGSFYYLHPKTDKGTYGKAPFTTREQAVKHYLDSEGLSGKQFIDPNKIKAIDTKAKAMNDFLLGDVGEGSSGRLAVIRGYDAVALNKSYQADSFMLLLNRSKVMVQDKDISFASGKKSGVGI